MAVSEGYISQELLDKICLFILEEEGRSVRDYFAQPDIGKTRGAFYFWMDRYATKEQVDQLAHAMHARQTMMAEDILPIADGQRPVPAGEGIIEQSDSAQRDRLRVDARFKLLAVMDPKKYGTRVNTALSDPDGNALPAQPVQFYLPANGRDDAEKA